MLYIFNDRKFTGTSYTEDKPEYRAHHEGQGEVCLWLSDSLIFEIGESLPDFDKLVVAETAEREKETKLSQLSAIDAATVRPLRAVLASGDSPEQSDLDRLAELEKAATKIRATLS